jgi:Ser/Thr protein kinase RdoA (MazF antagonist)
VRAGQSGTVPAILHGEPHPGNVLTMENGLLFIDLETRCSGPVEFDLAHAPEEAANTIRVSIKTCCASAGSSCWR